MAAENIGHASNVSGSSFRHLMGRAMNTLSSSLNRLGSVLQRLGVTYSRINEHRRTVKKCNELKKTFLVNVTLNKYCYAVVLFDNLGFKNRQGFQRGLGYEQFTIIKVIIKVIIIDEIELETHKIYGDNSLSRVSKDWEEIRNEESLDEIIAPNNSDENAMATSTITFVHAIMVAHSLGKFPTVEQAKMALCDEIYKDTEPPSWRFDSYTGDRMIVDIADDEIGEERTIYDLPMRLDLNKKDTVGEVLEYCGNKVLPLILSRDDEVDARFQNQVPFLLDGGRIAASGDGSPIAAGHGLLEGILSELKSKVLPVFGGFHLMLELFKKRGLLFETTHLRFITGMFFASKKAIDYVINPSDPNQANKEMLQYHLEFYLTALQALLELKFNVPEVNPNEVSLSPVDVIDFMIDRAKYNVQILVMLLKIRFAELIIMLQRAETAGDADIYCAALKYAMILCVNTKATKYVEMMCKFCIERHCMSEAQTKVLDVFILFRKTKNKKSIFSDRCIEWTMRDLRSYLGKYYQYATPNQLERLLLQMNIIKEEKGNIADAGAKPSARRFIKFDSAFLEVYVFCKSANLWSGVPQGMPGKGFKKRGEDDECTTPFPDVDRLYLLDGKQILYADVLSTV